MAATTPDIALVLSFIEAWNRRDIDAQAALLADDVFYHNIPMPPIEGKAAYVAAMGPMVASCSEIDWKVHHVADTGGGVVLTERTDAFNRGGKPISIRVSGTFEIRDGRITHWRDYFDLQQYVSQL